jgi:hypothetical protein
MQHFTTIRTRLFFSLSAGLACLIIMPDAKAAETAFMYDTFDYPAGLIDGTQNGGSGWSGSWSAAETQGTVGDAEILEGSLLFSDFPTTGNRVRRANDSSTFVLDTNRQYVNISRTSGSTKGSGDLWTAFLYQRIDPGGESTDQWVELRNNASFSLGMSVSVGNSFDYFGSGLGIRPRYGSLPPEPFDDSANAQNGDVYLMVARFTNIGLGGNAGVATMWALTESDYDAITANGSIDASELDANNYLKSVDTSSFVPQAINPGNVMKLVNGVRFVEFDSNFDSSSSVDGFDFLTWQRNFGTLSGAEQVDGDADANGTVDELDFATWEEEFGSQRYGKSVVDIDELRYGDALTDVVLLPPGALSAAVASVPEPSSLLLASLAAFLC